MSRRYQLTTWPTHKGAANRRRRPRPRRADAPTEPATPEAMAQALVDRGLASPRILTKSSQPNQPEGDTQ